MEVLQQEVTQVLQVLRKGSIFMMAGSQVTFSINSTFSISNTIAGDNGIGGGSTAAGGITMNGTGTVTLGSTNNTYTGTVSIPEGTLAILGDGSLGNTSNPVILQNATTNGSTLSVTANTTSPGTRSFQLGTGGGGIFAQNTGVNHIIQGVISGTGGGGPLTQNGPGTLTLEGINTYPDGTTTNNSSTLALSGSGTISNGPLSLKGTSHFDITAINSSVTIGDLSGVSGTTVALGTKSLTVTTSTTNTYAGNMTGSTGTFTIGGSGSLDLTGTASYTGLTTVQNTATLFANGSMAGGVTVQSGATLKGIGTINGAVTIESGGTISPGNSIGTITVGSYSLNPGSTMFAEISPPNSADLIAVTNTATLGGNLSVDFLAGSYLPGETFTLLEAGNLTSDIPFGNISYQNIPASLVPTITYTYGINGTVVLGLALAPSPPTVTLPATYAGGFLQTVLSDINHINSHITIRMQELRRRFSALPNAAIANNFVVSSNERFLALNPETEEKQELLRREVAEPEKTKPWSFYFGPVGRAFGEIHGKDDQPGADYWSVGGLIGFDYASSQVGVGLMANYERIYSHVKEHWGKIDVDEFQASIYLTYAPECLPDLAVNAIGGGSYEIYSIRRNTSASIAKGKPHGFGYDGLLGIEYSVGNKCFHFIPLVNAQYIYLRADGYNEHGAGSFDLHVQSQRVKSLRSSLGFRMNYYVQKCNFLFIPEIYGEWQREYLNKRRGIGIAGVASVFPGETLLVPGTGRNIALAGVDLLFTMHDRVGVEISYETEYNSLYHDHFFYLGVDFRF